MYYSNNEFNFEVHKRHLKLQVKWNWCWSFPSAVQFLWFLNDLFSWYSMENCLWCSFMLLFISLPFGKCKKVCSILKISLVLEFCPQKTKITCFPLVCLKKFDKSVTDNLCDTGFPNLENWKFSRHYYQETSQHEWKSRTISVTLILDPAWSLVFTST